MGGCCGCCKRQVNDTEYKSLEINYEIENTVNNSEGNEKGLQALNVNTNEVTNNPIEEIVGKNQSNDKALYIMGINSYEVMPDLIEETDDKNVKNINNLSDYDLYLIFTKLNFESKVSVQSVCHRWYQLIEIIFNQQKCLIISIDEIESNEVQSYTDSIGLEKNTKISMVCLRKIEICFMKSIPYIIWKHKRVQSLFLNLTANQFYLTPSHEQFGDILCRISQRCDNNLLDFRADCCSSGYPVITFKYSMVKSFCEKFKNIHTFRIDVHIICIRGESIDLMFKIWENIRVFELIGLPFNTENYYISVVRGYPHIFKNLNKNIERLTVHSELLTSNGLSILANKGMQRLECIDIMNIQADMLSSFPIIGDSFKSIKSMSLSFSLCMVWFFNESVQICKSIFQTFSKLIHLEKISIVSKQWYEMIISENAVQYLQNCKKLKNIRIKRFKVEENFIKVLSESVPQLECLFIESIELNGSEEVFSDGIKNIINLKSLRVSFRIYTGKVFSDNQLIAIINSCHRLEYIDVSECHSISISILSSLNHFAKRKPDVMIAVIVTNELKIQIQTLVKTLPKNMTFK